MFKFVRCSNYMDTCWHTHESEGMEIISSSMWQLCDFFALGDWHSFRRGAWFSIFYFLFFIYRSGSDSGLATEQNHPSSFYEIVAWYAHGLLLCVSPTVETLSLCGHRMIDTCCAEFVFYHLQTCNVSLFGFGWVWESETACSDEICPSSYSVGSGQGYVKFRGVRYVYFFPGYILRAAWFFCIFDSWYGLVMMSWKVSGALLISPRHYHYHSCETDRERVETDVSSGTGTVCG